MIPQQPRLEGLAEEVADRTHRALRVGQQILVSQPQPAARRQTSLQRQAQLLLIAPQAGRPVGMEGAENGPPGRRCHVAGIPDQPQETGVGAMAEEAVHVVEREGALAAPARHALGTPELLVESEEDPHQVLRVGVVDQRLAVDRRLPRMDMDPQQPAHVVDEARPVPPPGQVPVARLQRREIAQHVGRVGDGDSRVGVEDQAQQIGARTLGTHDENRSRGVIWGHFFCRGAEVAIVSLCVDDSHQDPGDR